MAALATNSVPNQIQVRVEPNGLCVVDIMQPVALPAHVQLLDFELIGPQTMGRLNITRLLLQCGFKVLHVQLEQSNSLHVDLYSFNISNTSMACLASDARVSRVAKGAPELFHPYTNNKYTHQSMLKYIIMYVMYH